MIAGTKGKACGGVLVVPFGHPLPAGSERRNSGRALCAGQRV